MHNFDLKYPEVTYPDMFNSHVQMSNVKLEIYKLITWDDDIDIYSIYKIQWQNWDMFQQMT